ncbi:hypothetical protein TNCV_1526061 [Trichonephila clavipes]|nr:hypothetical protein TNCV_1526061 [Trichonephila clavipes]
MIPIPFLYTGYRRVQPDAPDSAVLGLRRMDIQFERKFLRRKWNPAVYLQVDDHVHPGNCPAAVSSEKKTRPSSYGVLPSPAELGYERTDAVFFFSF